MPSGERSLREEAGDVTGSFKESREWRLLLLEFVAYAARNPSFAKRFKDHKRRLRAALAKLIEQHLSARDHATDANRPARAPHHRPGQRPSRRRALRPRCRAGRAVRRPPRAAPFADRTRRSNAGLDRAVRATPRVRAGIAKIVVAVLVDGHAQQSSRQPSGSKPGVATQTHPSPSQASRPSRTASAAIPSAMIGSSHHQPNAALTSKPASTPAAR